MLGFQKLEALNGIHMRKMDDAELLDALIATLPYLPNGASIADKMTEQRRGQLLAAMPGLKERAKTLVELVQGAEFLFTDGPRALDAAADKLLSAEGRAALAKALPALEATDWSGPALESAARLFAESAGWKLGQVAQPLRAALTGKASSPPLFEMLALLGREESLIRLRAYAT